MAASCSQVFVIAAFEGAALLVSWLIYVCSDTVELAVIAGGSNNEMLTNVDTCN